MFSIEEYIEYGTYGKSRAIKGKYDQIGVITSIYGQI